MAIRSAVVMAALWSGLTLPAGLSAFDGVPTGTAGFIGMAARGPLDTATLVASPDEFAATFGGYDATLGNPYLAPSVDAFFRNGGKRCYVVRVASDGASAYEGSPGRSTGIHALGEVDEISIVCAPGATSLAVQLALIAHCESRGDRLCILDPAAGAAPDDVREQRSRLLATGGHATLYYPWLTVDPEIAGAVRLPPSGFVAGVWARSDEADGVWTPPVGAVLSAFDVERDVGAAEQDVLNPLGINVIRKLVDRGLQVWGARTLSSDPEWKYVNVRRFIIFLERSIYEGTSFAVFEPNDEPLWASLRTSIETFLGSLWRSGAFPGATAREAYFVRVDRSTMNEEDLDAGRTVIRVGVAPLRPAEFIRLEVVHDRSDAVPRFVRGDTNSDGSVDIADPIGTLEFLFAGRTSLLCPDAADATDDGRVTITSAVYVLNFLFGGGPAIPRPFPDCDEDHTEDALGPCEAPLDACD